MEETMWGDEEIWRCRRHPSRPRSGVCPACLRDRLLRLCPDCAAERPCGCCGASTSSNSSSFSSRSSADLAGSGIGAVGRVASLIENEPAFRRSRSTALNFLRPRPEAEQAAAKPSGLAAIWPFARSSAVREEERADAKAAARMSRSRSVGVEIYPDLSGGGGGGGGGGGAAQDAKMKGWNWHFPSPMKAFRHRKSSAKVVLERSPMCRG